MDELINELSKHNVIYELSSMDSNIILEIWFDKTDGSGGITALYSHNIMDFHFFNPDFYDSYEKLSEEEKAKFRNYLNNRFGIIIKTIS